MVNWTGWDRQALTGARPLDRLATDLHLHLVLVATLLTGLGLWWLLPSGFAEPVREDAWRLLGFLVFYPVLEEWLFRGILQGELSRRTWAQARLFGLSHANLLTSIIFVLFHTIHQPWYWALSVIVPSLALGHFMERYGRLWLPMALHALFNLTFLLAGLA